MSHIKFVYNNEVREVSNYTRFDDFLNAVKDYVPSLKVQFEDPYNNQVPPFTFVDADNEWNDFND